MTSPSDHQPVVPAPGRRAVRPGVARARALDAARAALALEGGADSITMRYVFD